MEDTGHIRPGEASRTSRIMGQEAGNIRIDRGSLVGPRENNLAMMHGNGGPLPENDEDRGTSCAFDGG